MAKIHFRIELDGGMAIAANADVQDDSVLDMAVTLGSMLFDASLALPSAPAPGAPGPDPYKPLPALGPVPFQGPSLAETVATA